MPGAKVPYAKAHVQGAPVETKVPGFKVQFGNLVKQVFLSSGGRQCDAT